nr:SMI1/KNR4 family protein [Pseudomonas eucalypticola]
MDLYLNYNGGVLPEKSWVVTDDGYDPMQIADFKFIAKDVDSAGTEDILGCYQFMLMRDVIPHTLLPFAVDDGGNFFCLDMLNGTVQFYATDAFRPDRSSAANHLAAQKILASSFSVFLDNLELESGLDE